MDNITDQQYDTDKRMEPMARYILRIFFLVIGAIVVVFVLIFIVLTALIFCIKLSVSMSGKGVLAD